MKNEFGFTLMEILVSLALSSIFIIIVLAGLLNAQGLIRKINHDSLSSAKILQLDDYVRQAVHRIRLPFWIREICIKEDGDNLAVPYHNGEVDDYLIFKRNNNLLLIGSQKKSKFISFGPFDNTEIEIEKNKDGGFWGVKLTVTPLKKTEDTMVIFARFGSNPFSASVIK